MAENSENKVDNNTFEDTKNTSESNENAESKKNDSSQNNSVDNNTKNTENIENNEKQQENENSAKQNDANDKSEGEEKKADEKDPLTLANEKVKDFEDKYRRLLAEFDNFRKRSEKENASMCDLGASMVLTKMLPIVDNLERAFDNIPEDIKGNAFVEGIDKIYKQILKTFDDLDVKPIEAKGKTFDANFHNAVMTDEESDAEVDTITAELQKGYTYKNQVLRHSMVKVKK